MVKKISFWKTAKNLKLLKNPDLGHCISEEAFKFSCPLQARQQKTGQNPIILTVHYFPPNHIFLHFVLVL